MPFGRMRAVRNGIKASVMGILNPLVRIGFPKGSIKQSPHGCCNRGRSGGLSGESQSCVMIRGELPPAELSWRWVLTSGSE